MAVFPRAPAGMPGLALASVLALGVLAPSSGRPAPATRSPAAAPAPRGTLARPSWPDVKIPEDFVMPKGNESPGEVTFSHEKHMRKLERCSSCHMRGFKLKKGESGAITLDAKQDGKYCGVCHTGKLRIAGVTPFPIDDCDRCHGN
jgi:c(7)-type cytochrome triheme protein